MTPPAVTFRNRPRALLALGLFWAGESLLGFGLGAVLLAEARTMPAWILALGVLMALFLAIVGLHLSVLCLRQLGSPDPVLALGPEGYFDRRLCPHPIAWHLVSRVVVYHARGVQVAFELAPAADAGVRRLPRLLARLNRSVGLPGYSLNRMGIDATDVEIARAMHAWHAHVPPGADPA